MNKKIICFLLCMVMLLGTLVGCSSETTDEALDNIDKEASENAVTLAMYLLCEEEVSKEQEAKIEEAVNKITKSKFRTKLDLYFYTADKYYEALEASFEARLKAEEEGLIQEPNPDEKVEDETFKDELGVSQIKYPTIDGFQVDIFYVGGYEKFSKYMEEEKFSRLDDELTSASKILTDCITPSLLNYMKSMNGGTYALPTNTGVGEYTYLLLNKDVLAKTRYNTTAGLAQFTSLTCNATKSVISQVTSEYKEYVPLYSCLGENGLPVTGIKYWGVDENGVMTQQFSALASSYSSTAVHGTEGAYMYTIGSVFANQDFVNQVKTLKTYKMNGYFGTEQDLEDGKVAIAYMKGSADIPAKYADNYEAVVIENPVLNTEDVYSNMFAVSSYTSSVARSMQVLCYLNTNVEFRNLLLYGIEGENYQLVDSDDYTQKNGDPYKVVKRLNNSYMMDVNKTGNTLNAYVLEGEDPTLNEYKAIQNNSIKISLTMGFHFECFEKVVDPELLGQLRELSEKVYEKIAAIDCTSEATIDAAIIALRMETALEPCLEALADKTEPSEDSTTCGLGYAYEQWGINTGIYDPDDV